MKKVIAWLLVLALTAAISIGATLAYLTDTDEDVNVMTLGKVKIEQLEYERVDDETQNQDATVQEFHDNKPLYPAVTEKDFGYETGDSYVDWEQIGKDGYTSEIWDPEKINNEIDKMVFVKNTGDYDAYVRSVFAFEAGSDWSFEDFQKKIHLNQNTDEDAISWEWVETPVKIGEGTYFVAVATYKEALKPGAFTEISLSQIALDSSATNEDVEALGDTYHVLVKSQAIQADGFISAEDALNEGFGKITADENIPFDTDQPVKGIDVRSALRFYQGNAEQPIHTKVTNVVFGLNKDHANIVNNYEGTLVTEEQDVDVYSYYVEEDGKYTIYFLANGNVNLPRDSSGLFQDMKNLAAVDTGNCNVSRVETMRNMFRDCQVLASLDTTAWDTGMVNDMGFMFQNCYALKEIQGVDNWDTATVTFMRRTFYNCTSLGSMDLSSWETGKVTNLEMTFAFCNAMKELNVSGWDVANVTDMTGTFGQCFALEKVDTTGWKPVNVTTTKNMFFNNYKLKEVTGSGSWYMPKNINTYSMFQNCYELEYLDVTDWDLSSATNMQATFHTCKKLQTIEGSENWNTGNVTTMKGLCENCFALKDLDVSTWDTGSVESFSYAFRACESLEVLDVSQWDTGNVKQFNSMFSSYSNNTGAMKFTKLEIENWDTSSATALNHMFYGCSRLTELDLSKWDVANVISVSHMFADCYNIASIDFSGWNTSSLVVMDGMFNNCDVIKELDLSMFDTSNVIEFSQVFDACYSLETIIGLENWNTANGKTFDEMFNSCHKLKEVNLSSFDTRNAVPDYIQENGEDTEGFQYMFNGVYSLEKITLGKYVSFDGNGTVIHDKLTLPAPNSNIPGADGKWYDIATGTGYAPSEIPEETEATYVAVKPGT